MVHCRLSCSVVLTQFLRAHAMDSKCAHMVFQTFPNTINFEEKNHIIAHNIFDRSKKSIRKAFIESAVKSKFIASMRFQ